MKTSSWPKPNSKTTPYSNFFTFFDHPDLYHGTTLNKRPKIGHGDDTTLNNSPKTNDTEPSETSPFKGIHSTSLSANETNEDHNRIVGFFLGWDQKDRTLPEGPPSPNGSDTSVSVGSNTHIITSVSVATRQLLDIEAQTGNANSEDWQEEIYQKIEVMKEAYLPELTEMYHKIVGKLQQQPKNEIFEKLEMFKTMLERILQFLQVPKSNILPKFKEKLPVYEKQIGNFLNANRPRKPGPSLQQGQQIPPPPKSDV